MTAWTRLKVVELRAELKARGLPTTGLKPELVQRLTDADAAEVEAPAADESPVVDAEPSAIEPVDQPEATPIQESTEIAEATSIPPPVPTSSPSPQKKAPVAVTTPPKSPLVSSPQEAFAQEAPAQKHLSAQQKAPTESTKDVLPVHPEASIPADQPAAANTVPNDDTLDVQKRKRRSSTPAPSAKRVRQAEEQEDVVDFENSDIISASQHDDRTGVDKNGHDQMDVDEEKREGPSASVMANNDVPSVPDTLATKDQQEMTGEEAYLLRVAIAESSKKAPSYTSETYSSADRQEPQQEITGEEAYQLRVAIAESSKRRLSHTSETYPSIDRDHPQQEVKQESKPEHHQEVITEDDGTIVPSIHYATSALYIKNFMRPLRIPTVEEHIIDLATPVGSAPDPSIIETFYLDQIRTHAFVVLGSTSAAARVRSALHERVWPEESNRKPLWVDFVPPHKVPGWIHQEQSVERGNQSRWEVVYDQDEQGVTATLKEAGPDIKPGPKPPTGPAARPPILSGPNAFPGIEGAPRGPRGTAVQFQRPSDSGALWTRANPPLRYQPVDEILARRRIDNMKSFLSPDQDRELGREINRYSFERSDAFIDRGREQFTGIRPPPHVLRERQARDRQERSAMAGFRDSFRQPPPSRPAVNDGGRFSRRDDDRRPGPSYRDFRSERAPRGDRYYGDSSRRHR